MPFLRSAISKNRKTFPEISFSGEASHLVYIHLQCIPPRAPGRGLRAQKDAPVCPFGDRRAHFKGKTCPRRRNATAWAQKGALVCPFGGRRAHFKRKTCPRRRNATAWAQKGAETCPLGCRRAHFRGKTCPRRKNASPAVGKRKKGSKEKK